jgi:hypothetical protein
MSAGTDPATLFAVGAVGVAGTLSGVVLNDLLTRKREKRLAAARQRRAITAVVGELLDAVSIVNSAMRRQAWWPPGDAPRDRSWAQYADDLAEVLSDEQWNQVRMTYETLRSLDALREMPHQLAPPGTSAVEQARWQERWPDAEAAAKDSFQALSMALELLRPLRRSLPSDGE